MMEICLTAAAPFLAARLGPVPAWRAPSPARALRRIAAWLRGR